MFCYSADHVLDMALTCSLGARILRDDTQVIKEEETGDVISS